MNDRIDTRKTQIVAPDARAKGATAAKILVLSGPEMGRVLRLADRDVLVGRSRANDLVLGCRTVSGAHAAICPRGTGFTIEDVGSRNGTRVRGSRLRQREIRRLRHGDTIELGEVLLLFCDAPPNAPRTLGALRLDLGRVRAQVDALLGELDLSGASPA